MTDPRASMGVGLVHEVLDVPGGLTDLSVREARLLDGALAFHCLVRPGRVVRGTVLRSTGADWPSLTGEQSRRIEWADSRVVVGTVLARELGKPDDGTDPVDVVIDLGGPPTNELRLETNLPAPIHALRHVVRSRLPVAFDVVRQARTDRLESRRAAIPVPRAQRPRGATGQQHSDRPKAVLFGLHWFELGGAERWAAECIQSARAAGLVPIVISDRASAHPHIAREAFDGALVLPLTLPLGEEQESQLLAQLFERFDIRGIHVHHCTWLYQRLPWIRAHYPDTAMVDSLHVLEWRTGGFADIALRLSDVMDEHHVISPQLRDYLVDRHGLPPEKVTLATLADLTVEPAAGPPQPLALETPGAPFTVAFVGRFTQQKRPYLFLRLARRLHRRLGSRVRFVMHGDGELAAEVRADRARLGLASSMELRGPDRSVADTLTEADVLVISSDNEGVTLTSFEADAHHALVVSADVGSQASVVVDELLCPRPPLAFLREAEHTIVRLAGDGTWAARLAVQQRERMQAFTSLPRAREWTRSLYERWAQ